LCRFKELGFSRERCKSQYAANQLWVLCDFVSQSTGQGQRAVVP
jgi:hypothetical protein